VDFSVVSFSASGGVEFCACSRLPNASGFVIGFRLHAL
jgi:hypothetical protein